MDFGTGRPMDGVDQVPDLAGTPLYLAPEIFEGAQASERTDLYSLGVLLYHLVTGGFPVRAASVEALQVAHATHTAVRLRDARPDLPSAFVHVVDRAISPNPDERYRSAGELEAALIKAHGGGTPPTRSDTSRDSETPRRGLSMAGVVAAAVLATIVIAAFVSLQPLWSRWRTAPAIAPGAIKSIAVLPLVNLSGDPAQEYLADGMTDELIATLGRLNSVNVISRTSAMQFKRSAKSLPDIARVLHADAVLEGSVQVAHAGTSPDPQSDRVRINARLIYAGSDTQLWDRTFERATSDIFSLQRDVANAIVTGIGARLATVERQAASRAQDAVAIDLYLRGRYEWNRRTAAGFFDSIRYFEQALERDTNYAAAHAGLADAWVLMGLYGLTPRDDAMNRATTAAQRALELDNTLAEPHAALGLVHEERFEWLDAEHELTQALERRPSYATARHWYADYLAKRGRMDEAIAQIDQAAASDPLSLTVRLGRGTILLMARRPDDAIALLRGPNGAETGIARAHLVLAMAYAAKGAYTEAFRETDTATALGVDPGELRGDIGYIQALSGRRREALRTIADLTDMYQRAQNGTAAGGIAAIYSALNDRNHAFQWLERGRQTRDTWIQYLLADPSFDNLRNDPRYQRLLASVGLGR